MHLQIRKQRHRTHLNLIHCFKQKRLLLSRRRLPYLREIQVLPCLFHIARHQPVRRSDLIEPRQLRLIRVTVIAGRLEDLPDLRRRLQLRRNRRIQGESIAGQARQDRKRVQLRERLESGPVMPLPCCSFHRSSGTASDLQVAAALTPHRRKPGFIRHTSNQPLYFSLVGGAIPFSRRYIDSAEYCSLSCDTFPHSSPARDRFPGPIGNISVKFASVVAP
jgi:hypothetical protein